MTNDVSRSHRFQLFDRGHRCTLCLVPGWASDCRIISTIDGPFNLLWADGCLPAEFSQTLVAYLGVTGIRKVTLFGWSLGAHLALDFARDWAECVDQLWLASLRPRFPAKEIREQRAALHQAPREFLADFYRRCFAGQKRAWERFDDTLLEDYLNGFPEEHLIQGLDYLATRDVQPGQVLDAQPVILHGRRDLIAPVAEVEALIQHCPGVRLEVISDAGHLPFLSPTFDTRRLFEES